ncbi:hypothetical protein Q7P37_009770 [Cladosporium fusiforme]
MTMGLLISKVSTTTQHRSRLDPIAAVADPPPSRMSLPLVQSRLASPPVPLAAGHQMGRGYSDIHVDSVDLLRQVPSAAGSVGLLRSLSDDVAVPYCNILWDSNEL